MKMEIVISMPSYYESTIEPIEYMAANFNDDEYRGFLKGNIIKYISRAGKKGAAIDDIKKAGVYLEWLIELETPDESDMACKTLGQIMEETEAELAKKKRLKQDLDAFSHEMHMEWLRERDNQGWT